MSISAIEHRYGTVNASSAKEYVNRLAHAIGPGFHPETPIADYRKGHGRGKPLFSPAAAASTQASLDRVMREQPAIFWDAAYEAVRVLNGKAVKP